MEQNLSLYHTFYTVARTGNISAAAKELFISQPAVSKSIAKLEASLETTLLIRNSRGVTLTAEGQMLYARLADAFHSIELGEEQLRYESSREQEHLTIGVSTTLCKYVLLPHLKDFIKDNPHIRISIVCQSSYETIQALADGKIDIGLVGETNFPKDFIFKKTHTISDTFVTTKNYLDHLAIRTGIDYSVSSNLPDLLSNATLMMMDKQNLSRVFIENYIKDQQLNPANIIEVSTMDLLIEFTTIGLGISCLIKNFVEDELKSGVLTELALPFEIPSRNIGLIYKKKTAGIGAILGFIDEF